MDEKMMKHGAFSWFELMTSDVEAGKKFYQALFGWTYSVMPMTTGDYTVIKVNEEDVAGIMTMPADAGEMPPTWGIYLTVDNVDKTAEKAKNLGGKILVAPSDIPGVGRFSVLQDPQGAWFAVITYIA